MWNDQEQERFGPGWCAARCPTGTGSNRTATYICDGVIFILCNTSLEIELESFTNDHDSLGSFLFKWFDYSLGFEKILFLKFQGLRKFGQFYSKNIHQK